MLFHLSILLINEVNQYDIRMAQFIYKKYL